MEISGSIILSIVHSILFFDKEIGISMILFQIIFNGVMIYILQKKNKIQNKTGLILMIPILLLSSAFFIYANRTFYVANIVIIVILDLLMYVISTNKKDYLSNHLYNTFELFSDTIANCNEAAKHTKNITKEQIKEKGKINGKSVKKVMISLLVVIPIVGIVLLLLASADMIFANLFTGIEQLLVNINSKTVFDIIIRIIVIIVAYLIILSLIFRLQSRYQREETYINEVKEKDTFTIKMLLAILNIVYLIFCFIQISSLFGKINIGENFDYATYARRGFFQLMFVSFINFIIILVANKRNKNSEKTIQFMSLFLIVFTVIIAMSSMYRMYLYETEYGLTYLRMFVYVILITELVSFIPLIIYIFNKKLDFMKWCFAIGISSYCIVNCMNMEKIIISKNINRNSSRAIDYYYISRIASADSYDCLKEILENRNINEYDRKQIRNTILKIVEDSKEISWQEFNISKYRIQY